MGEVAPLWLCMYLCRGPGFSSAGRGCGGRMTIPGSVRQLIRRSLMQIRSTRNTIQYIAVSSEDKHWHDFGEKTLVESMHLIVNKRLDRFGVPRYHLQKQRLPSRYRLRIVLILMVR
jgi:hypothetical protein